MTPEETRKLVDHLDESRTGLSSASLERMIDQNPEAAQEWYYLNLAVDAVRTEIDLRMFCHGGVPIRRHYNRSRAG